MKENYRLDEAKDSDDIFTALWTLQRQSEQWTNPDLQYLQRCERSEDNIYQ